MDSIVNKMWVNEICKLLEIVFFVHILHTVPTLLITLDQFISKHVILRLLQMHDEVDILLQTQFK